MLLVRSREVPGLLAPPSSSDPEQTASSFCSRNLKTCRRKSKPAEVPVTQPVAHSALFTDAVAVTTGGLFALDGLFKNAPDSKVSTMSASSCCFRHTGFGCSWVPQLVNIYLLWFFIVLSWRRSHRWRTSAPPSALRSSRSSPSDRLIPEQF